MVKARCYIPEEREGWWAVRTSVCGAAPTTKSCLELKPALNVPLPRQPHGERR